MEERIQIEDLVKKITIENQYGQVLGDVYISPDDYNILERAKTAEKNIQEHIRDLEKQSKSLSDNEEELATVISGVDQKVKKEIDYLFDYPVSEVVFGNTHCLSTRRGVYFVENLLKGIMPVIERTVSEEAAASQKRMNKYLSDYQKSPRKRRKNNDW